MARNAVDHAASSSARIAFKMFAPGFATAPASAAGVPCRRSRGRGHRIPTVYCATAGGKKNVRPTECQAVCRLHANRDPRRRSKSPPPISSLRRRSEAPGHSPQCCANGWGCWSPYQLRRPAARRLHAAPSRHRRQPPLASIYTSVAASAVSLRLHADLPPLHAQAGRSSAGARAS